jgi:hypothetical protein
MARVLLAAALLFGACWTGTDGVPVESPPAAKAAPGEPLKLRVKLERTGCFGNCPAYSVLIDGSGKIEWIGHANVTAMGRREGHVSRFELDELSRRVDRARFFERDEYGELVRKPECQTVGSSTTCSFSAAVSICSDTSHAIISVVRGIRRHRIDNDHCNERPELDALEEYIDRIANTEEWIGQ